MEQKEYLSRAAQIVEEQAEQNPTIGIPVDPDVADHMGAFQSDENLDDVLEAKNKDE